MEDCSFGTGTSGSSNGSQREAEAAKSDEAGPFSALTWPYVAPSSLGLSDLTWSSLKRFSPRALPAFFVRRVCPKMAEATQHGRLPPSLFGEKGVEPIAGKQSPFRSPFAIYTREHGTTKPRRGINASFSDLKRILCAV